jgi:hypothetical protein
MGWERQGGTNRVSRIGWDTRDGRDRWGDKTVRMGYIYIQYWQGLGLEGHNLRYRMEEVGLLGCNGYWKGKLEKNRTGQQD